MGIFISVVLHTALKRRTNLPCGTNPITSTCMNSTSTHRNSGIRGTPIFCAACSRNTSHVRVRSLCDEQLARILQRIPSFPSTSSCFPDLMVCFSPSSHSQKFLTHITCPYYGGSCVFAPSRSPKTHFRNPPRSLFGSSTQCKKSSRFVKMAGNRCPSPSS